jgi:hypothetical protein
MSLFSIAPRHLYEVGGIDPACTKRCKYRTRMAWLLAGSIGLFGVTQAIGRPVCKPTLAFKDVRFSEMQRPTLERRWTATVTADASRCATTAGYFEVGVSRMKESGYEIEFREQFIWSSPSVLIGIDFSADEAVETYWVDSVQACPCAADASGLSGLLPTDAKPN